MKKFIFLGCLLLLFKLSFAGVNLSGTVTEISVNGDEQPVSGATLQLLGTKITDVSEADGSFTLSNVPADSYGIAIKASKNGYKDSYTMPMGVGEEDEDEIPIILLSSYVYNFLVQGGDAPGHTEGKGDIIGEVDDLNGDPVSGVSIQAKYIENGDDAGTVMYFNDEMQPDDSREATGNSGIFCIYNVDPGKPIQITATSAGKTFSSRIAIAYSDSITFVGVFQTEGNLDVNGSVEDEEENAVEGVTVSIPGTNFFTQTNETGNFTLVLPDFSPVFFRLAKNEYKNMY